MIKAILWDLGGVLATNSPRLFISEFAIKYELEVLDVVKAFKITFGKWLMGQITEEAHWKSMLDELNLPIPEETFITDCKEMLRFFAVINGEVLEYIKEIAASYVDKEEKIVQAIASNNPKELGSYLTKEYGLAEILDSVVYSGDIGMAKPDKEFFSHVAKKLGVDASDCVFIDDKEKNLRPAEELGMTGILFKDVPQLKEEINNIIEVK